MVIKCSASTKNFVVTFQKGERLPLVKVNVEFKFKIDNFLGDTKTTGKSIFQICVS